MNKDWQQAWGRMPHGIYVLTACHAQVVNGMIASWVTQVSYEPPLIMTAVHPRRYSHELIDKGGAFALHVVDRAHPEIVERMMGPDPMAKFSGIDWRPGRYGCPLLKDCLAWFECTIVQRHRPGNHTLFIGQVVDAGYSLSGSPLCTFDCQGVYLGNA